MRNAVRVCGVGRKHDDGEGGERAAQLSRRRAQMRAARMNKSKPEKGELGQAWRKSVVALRLQGWIAGHGSFPLTVVSEQSMRITCPEVCLTCSACVLSQQEETFRIGYSVPTNCFGRLE